MPLYEYECEQCGHRLEVIQKFSDDLLTVCPACRGTLRKLISSSAFQFKGTGWYVTDYGRKGQHAASPQSPPASDVKAESAKSDSGEKSPSDSAAKPSGESSTASKAAGTKEASKGPSKDAAKSPK